MCGICGSIGPAARPLSASRARAMSEAIRHRGPQGDGHSELRHERAGLELQGWLGHNRLRVLDLTECAHQPMTSPDGSISLVYNGEVYNFRELRRELVRGGRRFRSSGDTEVVLAAYERWGDGLVERIDGMFALAVWDGRTGRMLLARDRTGKKPLFYSLVDGRLSFASEVKALHAAGLVAPAPDLSSLPEFLAFGYLPSEHTMWADVAELPPASTLSYDGCSLDGPRRFWDAPPQTGGEPPPAGAPLEQAVRERVREAVRRRLVSDVPLGAFLSGGIDSSLVVALMTELSDEPVRTFSIGFPDEPSYDERSHARRVAEHVGTEHTEFAVTVDAAGLLDRLIWHHDGPFADDSAVPTYLVCELASRSVTVALTGDGGDEVFGGYARFSAARLAERVPPNAARLLGAGTGLLPRSDGYFGLRRRAERFLARPGAPLEARYLDWIAIFDPESRHELLLPPVREAAEGATLPFERWSRRAAGAPPLDRLLYGNFHTYLPGDLAVKMDRMSMAHSLEVRSPLLDTAVIELLASVPAARKVGLRRIKPVVRRAFRPLLPDSIWNRPKHGFSAPVDRWFRSELGPMFEDVVLSDSARLSSLLDPKAVRAIWEEHRRGERDHGSRLWTLLTLERWLELASRAQPPGRAAALSA